MTTEDVFPVISRQRSDDRPPYAVLDDPISQWRLLGRARQTFVKEMRQFESCPANVFYWDYDPMARQFANDIHTAMNEAGWNVTLAPETKKLVGIKIVTRSPQLHAEEIAGVVGFLRGIGFDAKVRIRPDLETEAIQIVIGSVPRTSQQRAS